MLKAKDLRDKSIEELEAAHEELSHELFQLVNEYQVSKKLDQPHRLITMRRDKARILTVINEKRQKNNAR
jgi:ribosomal protein L29